MKLTIALAGNPNCGKTTLFNQLTGSNQFVGNWPGVTVEKKEGKLKGHKDVIVTDLPGIYSLSPYTLEEVVARDYLLKEKPDVILNIVDGSNLERNLYLSTQLHELGIPMVMAVNMMDIVKKNGDKIHLDKLSQQMGCPALAISALRGEGIQEAVKVAIRAGETHEGALATHRFSDRVESAIEQIEAKLEGLVPDHEARFFAVKLFERDDKIQKALPDGRVPDVERIIAEVEAQEDDDAESIITNERYTFIQNIIDGACTRRHKGKMTLSDKIDSVVTNRFLALPIFAAIITLVYYISVTTVGTWATDWANDGVFGDGWSFFGMDVPGIPVLIGGLLEALGTGEVLTSLVLDGIVAGVGAVLGFVPQLFILFFLLAFLEGCGYMARVAFIMDRIFRKFGLSGKSFIPLLVASGCGVPGVMASRTIENSRDRRMTIMTTTFIPCSAKLPVIALIAGALFGGAAWVAPASYFVGIAAVIFSGILLKKTAMFAGDPAPFVMELPAYHMPRFVDVLKSMWDRGYSFIKKAGTIVLLSTILVWFLSSFGLEGGAFGMVEDMDNSLLGRLGQLVAWIFIPLGWGDWKAAVATLTGLVAKENVVGTFGVLFGFAEVAEDGAEIWGSLQSYMIPLAAFSFLVFNLLCAPCFAAVGAIKKEMNSPKWTFFALGYQTGLAYSVSMIIYQFGLLIGYGQFSVFTVIAAVLLVGLIYLIVRPAKWQRSGQDYGVKAV